MNHPNDTRFPSQVAETRAQEHRDEAIYLLDEYAGDRVPEAIAHALIAIEARLEVHHWETRSD